MFVNDPTVKLRSILSISNLNYNRSSSSSVRWLRTSSARSSSVESSVSTQQSTIGTVPSSIVWHARAFSPWSSRSNLQTSVGVTSPREIYALPEDLSRSSSRVAELNHEAHELTSVNVDKLERKCFVGNQADEGQVNFEKTSKDCDRGEVKTGEIESANVPLVLEGLVKNLEGDVPEKDRQRPEARKTKEEIALDQVTASNLSQNTPSDSRNDTAGDTVVGEVDSGKVGTSSEVSDVGLLGNRDALVRLQKTVEENSKMVQLENAANSGEDGIVGVVAMDSRGENRKSPGKAESSSFIQPDNNHAQCIIMLASKGPEEEQAVVMLKGGIGLRLPEGAVVMPIDEGDIRVRKAFDVDVYLKNLSTSKYGRFVLYSPVIPSTQTILSQNFHELPHGSICIAGAQLQGKGRGGNAWQSPKGCLMFSFMLQMANGRLIPFIQYVVSLAILEAVEKHCKTNGLPVPDLRIKWPNDLFVNGVKIGGVLCTSTYRAGNFNIVIGIGLNVGNREPTTCLDAIMQELDGKPHCLKQEELLAGIMFQFETLNNIFQEQGFLPLQGVYCKKWLHSRQKVVLEEKEPESSNVSHVVVTIQGLTSTGFLLATDEEGSEYELHPDGNSFDFMRGLVRQKLSA